MKNKIPYILKIIIAGVLAFIVLNILCLFYYNVPNRVSNNELTTDYKWESYSIYSKLTEGLVLFDKTNNEGFHNIDNYVENEKVDVLVMGSSHTEGFNVKDNEIFSEVLKKNTDLNVYNIGMSDHSLVNCVQNLENALDKYKPSYVIIETMDVSILPSVIEETINNKLERSKSFENTSLKHFQNMKFLRLAYSQYQNTIKINREEKKVSNNTEESMNQLMNYIEDVCIRHNTKCIILFHPTLTLDNNNQITVNVNNNDLYIMEKICKDNNITFINMESDFVEYYKESYNLPHGFNNTIPGKGHLNKYGHKIIAERLKKVIEDNK